MSMTSHTPAEIIKSCQGIIDELNELKGNQPSFIDFKFKIHPSGRLATFNEIEYVEMNARIQIKKSPGRPRKETSGVKHNPKGVKIPPLEHS